MRKFIINQFKFTLIFAAMFTVATFFIKEIFQYFTPIVHVILSIASIKLFDKTCNYNYFKGVLSSLKVGPLGMLLSWSFFFLFFGSINLISSITDMEIAKITQDATATTLSLFLNALPALIGEAIKLIPLSFIIPVFFIFSNKKTATDAPLDADLFDGDTSS